MELRHSPRRIDIVHEREHLLVWRPRRRVHDRHVDVRSYKQKFAKVDMIGLSGTEGVQVVVASLMSCLLKWEQNLLSTMVTALYGDSSRETKRHPALNWP
jgi:hypothetical protein